MKFIIADMASDCFPEDVSFSDYDAASTARIKTRVMEQIRNDRKRRRYSVRRAVSIAVLIAAMVALLTFAAYALGLFQLNIREVPDGEIVSGTWTYRNVDGEKIYVQTMEYDNAGFVFTYDSSAVPNQIRFKPGWLPVEGTAKTRVGQDWYKYYGSTDGDIPYVINVFYAAPGFQLVLMGDCELVQTAEWDGFSVTELTVDYYGFTNYIVMFNEADGYMITVGGTSDMETLERIAADLEIEVTDTPYEYNPDLNIAILNIGRG